MLYRVQFAHIYIIVIVFDLLETQSISAPTPAVANLSGTKNVQELDWDKRKPLTLDVPVEFPIWVDDWVAPVEIRKLFPYYLTGYDEDGCSVYVLEYGKWRYAHALASSKESRAETKSLIAKYLTQGFYRMLRDGMANGGQGIGGIIDWTGFTLANFADPEAIQLALRPFAMLNTLSVYLNYALLINANFATENFLLLAKPFMGNIFEKCEMFGTQKRKWLPHVLKKISKSQLPPWYGGEQSWKSMLDGGERIKHNSTVAI